MKKKSYLTGCIFLSFGIYFLLQHYHISLFQGFYTWPTLLIIIGLGFLVNGYVGKDYDSILPGVILTGIGIHFHITNNLPVWPEHSGIFLLLIALGLLLRYVKTGSGLFSGILFLTAAILLLFFDKIVTWANNFGYNLSFLHNIMPLIFIGIGIYLIYSKKK
ncbi:LiaI-LiaF-like domain-containing protein [Lederbergia graminis]|uniref:LiaI-LiaF-like domain-containing protein n=1 Tax=Lederbergia graminis TaxID=735518 RepID=A0ABW0LLJ8_9BACI|nr:DUF5668 domain-containing protein [Paenibacillus bovis]HLU23153.1 DUF5668 domain-containing protein [Bacillaceae bacterium]